MGYFLEERLSELIRYGSSWTEDFAVQESKTAAGARHGALIHPYPIRTFDASYMLDEARLWTEVTNVYMRAFGTFAGFRARCFDEWSTNGQKGAPTAFDQPMGLLSAGVYELRKYYGRDKTALPDFGYPHRKLKKPVAGTVKVGIALTEIRSADWAVDTTTGHVTFAADQTFAISGISKAAQAVINLTGHTLVVGQSVQVSGVAGMTQINGLRALIVAAPANQITVAINSTAFSTWTSGGVVHTRPQPGESVTAGCEFDFPIHFVTPLPVGMDYPGWRPVESLKFEELLEP